MTTGLKETGNNGNSDVASININPVEMIARLRRHASMLAARNNSNINDDDNNNGNDGDGIYSDDELHSFISMYVRREIPDYQMSAWLMAVCFCPLTSRETATLTRCYAESGTLLTWPTNVEVDIDIDIDSSSNNNSSDIQIQRQRQRQRRRPPLVDKHSSGGVGDKISLILAPLVATCGVAVPMMAGRGLGHTGGTIDKLETSFPAYTAEPSVQDFQEIVLGKRSTATSTTTTTTTNNNNNNNNNGAQTENAHETKGVGCAIVAAGPALCPADRRIYALRDVTATVSCLPLQTASIMSKKIAERPDSLVLDVKYGDGAFQATVEGAQELAESMVAVGEANGLTPTTAFLTDMNHPIGRAVGNWVEVEECIDVMKGNLKDDRLRLGRDLIALVVIQAGQMLYQSSSSKRTNNGNENPGETEQEEDECIGGIAAAKLVSTPASALTGDEEESYKQYERMSLNDCIRHAYRVLDSGRVLDKFRQMLLAQGAEPTHLQRALETPEAIPLAAFKAVWTYQDKDTDAETATNPAATYIVDIPAKTMGDVAVLVGAGRTVASDKVDGQAGLVFGKQTGDLVASGEIIVTIYTNRS
uniref:Pyrimidine nucleoside phosphorylase C-terminal domain-containing protein n=1 Tax=Pseudo-nitzschia australis TaxID=44445 RepID=A0A7S4AFN3_9STRA